MRAVLDRFDSIFAVLEDGDQEITRWALQWAEQEGRLGEAAPELLARTSLSDAEIEAAIAERSRPAARATSLAPDQIRKELAEKGVLLRTPNKVFAGSASSAR